MARPIVVDSSDFAAAAAGEIGRTLKRAIQDRQKVTLALTGGTTVGPVYEHLAAPTSVSLHWTAISFYFGDERAVAPDHRDSNYRLARETLLSRIPVGSGQVHRMEAERVDLDRAAREYDASLPSPLDLLLLGVGADGHVASLFPASPALGESTRRVVSVVGGIPNLARLTVTPVVLAEARAIIVMASGSSKRDAVARALEGPLEPFACPAQLVRQATWVLDHAAASGLRSDWRP